PQQWDHGTPLRKGDHLFDHAPAVRPPVDVVAQENQGVEFRGVDGPDQGSQRRRAAVNVSDGDGALRQGVASLCFFSGPHSGFLGQSTRLTVPRSSPNTNAGPFPPTLIQGVFGSPGTASVLVVSVPSSLNHEEIRRLHTRQHRFSISPATALAHFSASSIVVIPAGTARLL